VVVVRPAHPSDAVRRELAFKDQEITMSRSILQFVTALMLCVTGLTIHAQQPAAPSPLAALAADRSAVSGSPAERRIAAARKEIARDATRTDMWNDLALALARRARETADPSFYKEAWQATERSLALEPGNLEARKLQVWILLGQHEFARAVEAGEALNKAVPDDVLVYGFLADAYVELGQYDKAEKAAQWMLDMRPGNVPGLTRAAHLRELFGDHDGSVEFMDTAYRRIADREVEDRAWVLTQIAHVSLLTCRAAAAEQVLNEALSLFPEYHYALAQFANLRAQQGRWDEAVALRERHFAAAPHPENQYELGVALARAGRTAEAQAAWDAFESAARKESASWDNANIELIYYYADHANRPADALALAEREAKRRQDVRTLEALAWALHKNNRSRDGQAEMKKALAVGIKDPVSFYHAGAIAAAAGAASDARNYLEQSLSSCSTSLASDEARRLQQELTTNR
jgi:tetratricopeptide (TPR) repeat protein